MVEILLGGIGANLLHHKTTVVDMGPLAELEVDTEVLPNRADMEAHRADMEARRAVMGGHKADIVGHPSRADTGEDHQAVLREAEVRIGIHIHCIHAS
jgi:hypothetical protein